MPKNEPELTLTVVLTVVSGVNSVRRCLSTLVPQINFDDGEIIVPFDQWSKEVGELALEFPAVRFYHIEDLGLAQSAEISAHQHRLYDRRRAVGLEISRGRVVAMTEDHALPAADWCRQILAAHEESSGGVIGGAIENGVNAPFNWAWYYCDFGRYGRPLPHGEIQYVSDINVSYKRCALEAVREVWRGAFHETTVHRAMQKRGIALCLNEKIIVFQNRPPLSIISALRERVNWGRVFAETRTPEMSFSRRLTFAAGTIILPPLLLRRVLKNMRRQNRSRRQMMSVLPLALLLLIGWSLGELFGYLKGEPPLPTNNFEINDSAHLLPEGNS